MNVVGRMAVLVSCWLVFVSLAGLPAAGEALPKARPAEAAGGRSGEKPGWQESPPVPVPRPDGAGSVGSLDAGRPVAGEGSGTRLPAGPAPTVSEKPRAPGVKMAPGGGVDDAPACAARLAGLARVVPLDPIEGEGGCGIGAPYDVASVGGAPPVTLVPSGRLSCPTIAALAAWTDGPVQQAAREHLGQSVAGFWVAASYACRRRNGMAAGKLSAHADGTAIDISAFVLEDGSVVDIRLDWQGKSGRSEFLHRVHAAACAYFTTVLGPEADSFHRTHFHLDLVARKNGYRLCE